MDDPDADLSHYRTPLLTPHVSDNTRTEDHQDLELSISQNDYLRQRLLLHTADESESESDGQAQQPSEAADDNNHPGILKKEDSVEKTIDISLYPQASDESDDAVRSAVQDTGPSSESYSGVEQHVEDTFVGKASTSSTLVCQKSLCVPYTTGKDEHDEISQIKQTLTTTTTTITTEYTEPKKEKGHLGHIMISYNHSTRALCSQIARALKNSSYLVWIDQDNISGDILTSMASAVENAFVVLMAVNEQYFQSRYCRLEAEYAVEQNKPSIPLLMQAGYKPSGWLGIINGSKLFIDFSQMTFDTAFGLLLREIEAIRISLEVDDDHHDRTSISTYASNSQSITTVHNTRNYFDNVHEWSTDDVIEWLHRERLEIFQDVLMGFTGATLWQLYKIKFDSPSDYYRTIESLPLPPTPLRLFFNLTFNGALESLFSSSSNQIIRRV